MFIPYAHWPVIGQSTIDSIIGDMQVDRKKNSSYLPHVDQLPGKTFCGYHLSDTNTHTGTISCLDTYPYLVLISDCIKANVLQIRNHFDNSLSIWQRRQTTLPHSSQTCLPAISPPPPPFFFPLSVCRPFSRQKLYSTYLFAQIFNLLYRRQRTSPPAQIFTMVSGACDKESGLAPTDRTVADKGTPSPPTSDTSDASLVDEAEAEKHLVRKIDLTVFPILFVVYMLSFLDRINISNAKIQGLTEELDLSGHRFNIALFVRSIS